MKARKNHLKTQSKRMLKSIPKSEQWLLTSLIELQFPGNDLDCRYKLKHGPKTNGPIIDLNNRYIPTIVSHKYKFLIEVEDFGDFNKSRLNQSLRDKYYTNNGYKCVIINSFSNKTLFKSLNNIYKHLITVIEDDILLSRVHYWANNLI
jgi:hypothetical protein